MEKFLPHMNTKRPNRAPKWPQFGRSTQELVRRIVIARPPSDETTSVWSGHSEKRGIKWRILFKSYKICRKVSRVYGRRFVDFCLWISLKDKTNFSTPVRKYAFARWLDV